MRLKVVAILALLSFAEIEARISYRNYKSVSLEIQNQKQLAEIQSLEGQPGVKINNHSVQFFAPNIIPEISI